MRWCAEVDVCNQRAHRARGKFRRRYGDDPDQALATFFDEIGYRGARFDLTTGWVLVEAETEQIHSVEQPVGADPKPGVTATDVG